MVRKFVQKIKKHFHEVARTKVSSHAIALGFSIGTFISILPTPGFNIILGFLVVLMYRKVNKFSLFGSMVFWNPFTLAPLYWASNKIGTLIFGPTPIIKYEVELLDQIYNFSRRFLAGNIIAAVAVSVASYFIIKQVVEIYRKKRKK